MELILHNNVRSMFSEKVRRVLAYKGLDWTDVQVPGLPPNTHFVPLTGGYRRMPALQIGADVYCDSALIVQKLEDIAPDPTVFPPDCAGAARMIADWADHRVAMWSIIAVFPDFLAHASDEFIKDRTALVAEFAPERVAVLAPHMLAQVAQFAGLVDQALTGHDYVAGPQFSVADAACYHVLAFAKNSPRVFAAVQQFHHILDWMARIEAFPQPQITQREPDYALAAALAAEPVDIGGTCGEGEAFALGQCVAISADDYAKEQIIGPIVKLTPTEIAVGSHGDQVGDIAIHFPRLGFTIAPVD